MKKLILGLAAASFCALAPLSGLNMTAFAGPNEDALAVEKEQAMAGARKAAQQKHFDQALPVWRKYAALGDRKAQNNLGLVYENGLGAAQSYSEAAAWYHKSANQGFAGAQFSLGNLYKFGKGVAQNDAEAAKWFRKSADNGFPRAQYNLGNLYRQGKGAAQDYAVAAQWFRKAAVSGYTDAMLNLGVMYENGDGVAQNNVAAKNWYEKAKAAGAKGAGAALAQLAGSAATNNAPDLDAYIAAQTAPRNSLSASLQQTRYTNPLFSGDFADAINAYDGGYYVRALAMFQKLAQNNDGPALYWLSNMHQSGYKVPKSKTLSETYLNRALPIIRKSANEDDPRALYYLSEMYDIGRGVKASRKKSLRHLKRAAELGYTEAYLKMAKQYRLGKGVKKNTAKALAYKHKAADQGYVAAMYQLAENYSIDYRSYNISKDLQIARKYYLRAANNGHLVSMQRLGLMDLNGDGGARSPIDAKDWFVKARDGGYEYNILELIGRAEQAIEGNKEYALRQKLARLNKEKEAVKNTLKLTTELEDKLLYHMAVNDFQKGQVEKAISVWEQLASSGHYDSQLAAGLIFMDGKNVEQSISKSDAYLTAASNNIYTHSFSAEEKSKLAAVQAAFSKLYEDGNSVPVNKSRSFFWMEKSAQNGLPVAMFLVGTSYELGTGTEQSKEQAVFWYKKAAAHGDASAKKQLKRLGVQ